MQEKAILQTEQLTGRKQMWAGDILVRASERSFALALHEHPMFERNRCSVVGNAVIRPLTCCVL